MRYLLDIVRPVNSLMAMVAVFIGAFIGGMTDLSPVLLAMFSAFFITGAGMVINDYFDREVDRINRPERVIPSGLMSPRAALIYSISLFLLGIILSIFINIWAFLLATFNSLLLIYYAKDLQKKFFAGNIAVSYLVGSTFVYGGIAVGSINATIILAAMAFFANTAREIFKDMEDVVGDRINRTNSLPIKMGEEKSKRIGIIFILSGVALAPLPLLLNIFDGYYIYAIIPSIGLFLYSIYHVRRNNICPAQKTLKFAMIIGLVAFLVGAI